MKFQGVQNTYRTVKKRPFNNHENTKTLAQRYNIAVQAAKAAKAAEAVYSTEVSIHS